MSSTLGVLDGIERCRYYRDSLRKIKDKSPLFSLLLLGFDYPAGTVAYKNLMHAVIILEAFEESQLRPRSFRYCWGGDLLVSELSGHTEALRHRDRVLTEAELQPIQPQLVTQLEEDWYSVEGLVRMACIRHPEFDYPKALKLLAIAAFCVRTESGRERQGFMIRGAFVGSDLERNDLKYAVEVADEFRQLREPVGTAV